MFITLKPVPVQDVHELVLRVGRAHFGDPVQEQDEQMREVLVKVCDGVLKLFAARHVVHMLQLQLHTNNQDDRN